MQSAVAKARGHTAQTRYPQTEATLGEVMTKGQQDLGDESIFGWCLSWSHTSKRLALISSCTMLTKSVFFFQCKNR